MKHVPLPRMVPVQQNFYAPELNDIATRISDICRNNADFSKIPVGSRIAIAVGSRGICSLAAIVSCLIKELKCLGADPFIIPAMGSHGGATSQGQKEVLAGYGITEASMGVTIRSSMDVTQIGLALDHIPVYVDSIALDSDGIIVVNRVKPHTAFIADIESGLVKMLAIGLGNHQGATVYHSYGYDVFGHNLPYIGQVIIDHAPVIGGLAVLENAYDRLAALEWVSKDEMLTREKELLARARGLMPKILIDGIDVLIVHELGKDISGAGMDPNITGKFASGGGRSTGMKVERIVVLNLSEKSHGNALGIGAADVTTAKVVENMNLQATYANAITCTALNSAKIPVYMQNDYEAIQVALKTCPRVQHPNSRIVWIKNTLSLDKIFVSESLIDLVKSHSQMEVLGQPQSLEFDEEGNLVWGLENLSKG